MSELTAHRTLALRQALGERPDIALLAALHALCLKVVFYSYARDSCLDLEFKSIAFAAQGPGLNDSGLATALAVRHQARLSVLPREPGNLWDALVELDADAPLALFGHCVTLSVNALFKPYSRRPRAPAHADRLAAAVDIDMAVAGWVPTALAYLGWVSKARVLDAVRETKGEVAARRIAHLKKGDMAAEAETLLAGYGWLPGPLRTPGRGPTIIQSWAAISEAPNERQTTNGTATGVTTNPVAAEPKASVEHAAIAAE